MLVWQYLKKKKKSCFTAPGEGNMMCPTVGEEGVDGDRPYFRSSDTQL